MSERIAPTTIAVAPVPAVSGLTLTLQASPGAWGMPGGPFRAVMWPANVPPTNLNAETVLAQFVAGGNDVSVTIIERGILGSTAQAVEAGWQFADIRTAGIFQELGSGVDARGSGYSAHNVTALQAARAAIAGRAAAPATIYTFGDSVFEGYSTSSPSLENAIAARLETDLRQRYPTVGEGVGLGRMYFPILPVAPSLESQGWTVAGGADAVSLAHGINAHAVKVATAGVTFTKTFPVGVTDIDVLFAIGPTFTGVKVKVDAEAVKTFEIKTGANRSGVAKIEGLSATEAHTIVITTIGTENVIDGAIAYYGNRSKGIHVINASHYGAALSQYGQQTGGTAFAWYNPAAVNPATWDGLQSWTLYPPDLIILDSMINEYCSATAGIPQTAAVMKEKLEQFIASMATEFPSRPISYLLLSTYKPLRAQTSESTWAELVAAKEAVAAANASVAHLNLGNVMPAFTAENTLGLYSNDEIHGSPKGYQFMADTIASFLQP